MSLLKTFQNILRQHTENLDKSLSDPARDGHFAIEDASAEITRFETQLRDLMTQTNGLRKKRDDQSAEVQKYQAIAEKAAKSQNAADVTAALQAKAIAQKNLDTLSASVKANEAVQLTAQQHIDAARQKLEQAKNTEEQAKTRIATAQLRTDMAQATSTLGSHSALSQIDALSDAADQAEAKAEATEQLASSTPDAKNASLVEKYSETAIPVDAEAAALMAQFKPAGVTT